MQKLLITLLFIVVMIPTLAQEEEPVITVPKLSGLTVPEAASVLNEHDMLLNTTIQSVSSEEADGTLNTIVKQSPEDDTEVAPDSQTVVTVTVLRENNLLLLYDPNIWEEDDITFVNTSKDDINLTGLTFTGDDTGYTFEAREFGKEAGRVLPAEKCFQAWGRPIRPNEFYTPEECQPDRLQNGIISNLSSNQHFWQGSKTFTVEQDGIYRGNCNVALGHCKLWVSPSFIAEDVTEYAYFVYDEHELVVFNRAEKHWMPLYQIQLDNIPESLDNLRIWSSTKFEDWDSGWDLRFLAPGECAIFTDGSHTDPLVDCSSIMAQKNYPNEDLFWSDGFTVKSLHKDGVTRNCPPPSGRTFCMTPRYEWDR